MSPSNDVPEKTSEDHQSVSIGTTPVPAKRNKPLSYGSSTTYLETDCIKSSVGFLRAKSVNDDLDRVSQDLNRGRTRHKASNQQLGSSRAQSMNTDLNQPRSTSSCVKDLISEFDSEPLVKSRSKSMFTDQDKPSKDTACVEKMGSKLPMYKARLTVIPSYADDPSGGISCYKNFQSTTELANVENIPSEEMRILEKSNLIRNKISTSCSNSSACKDSPIGCGVNCKKVRTSDSSKELRMNYLKKSELKSTSNSITDLFRSKISSSKIVNGKFVNFNRGDDDTSTSQFPTRSNPVVNADNPNAESELSILPSGFLDVSYNRAVRKVEDDYQTDLASAHDISFRKPGEQTTISSISSTAVHFPQPIKHKDIGVPNIQSINGRIQNANPMTKVQFVTQNQHFQGVGQDNLSLVQHSTNQLHSQLPKSSQQQTSEPQSGFVFNFLESNPPKPPRLNITGEERLVKSQRVQLPQRHTCTLTSPEEIFPFPQQSQRKDHMSKSNHHQLTTEVEHFNAQPLNENLLCYSQIMNELKCQPSEENQEQWQDEQRVTLRDRSCQTYLSMPSWCSVEPKHEKQKSEAEEKGSGSKSMKVTSHQPTKSREPPGIVAVQRKAPSAGYNPAPPAPRNSIKRNPSSKKRRASRNRPSKRCDTSLLPKICLQKYCRCSECYQKESTLQSTLLYHTGNSPRARAEDVVMAPCVNQYIESIFSGLDNNNAGFITEEQFAVLMRILGCYIPLPDDKTKKISSVEFAKRLWLCWNQNHGNTTLLDQPKTSEPFIHAILNSKSEIENMENLNERLENINTSMSSVTSSDSFESINLGQGIGQRVWQNKERELARSKENRCLKNALKKLRSAMVRLGVENVILKVKLQLESPGLVKTTSECLKVQNDVQVQSNGAVTDPTAVNQLSNTTCTKCRKHQCPGVDFNNFESDQNRSPSHYSKLATSDKGINTSVNTETPEKKKPCVFSDDNSDELYLPMNEFQKSPTVINGHSPSTVINGNQDERCSIETNIESKSGAGCMHVSENIYANDVSICYNGNPMYGSFTGTNDDESLYMSIMDQGSIKGFTLDDVDEVEEISSFESDSESTKQFIRSYRGKSSPQSSNRSKCRVSYSTRSSRSNRIRSTKIIARHRNDCAPPPLPRRRWSVKRPALSLKREPYLSPILVSQTPFGRALEGSDASMPNSTSTPIYSKINKFPRLNKPTDTLQNLVVPQHNYTKSQLLSPNPPASLRPNSTVSSGMLCNLNTRNGEIDLVGGRSSENPESSGRLSHQPQQQQTSNANQDFTRKSDPSRETVRATSEFSRTDVVDVDQCRGKLKNSGVSTKSLLSTSTTRKSNTGRDLKTPKKTISGRKRARALPELLATRALLLEALSVVRAAEGSPADDETSSATHLSPKPNTEDKAVAITTAHLEDGNSAKSTSGCQKATTTPLEITDSGFVQQNFISEGEDERQEAKHGIQEETSSDVKILISSAIEKEEEVKIPVSKIESSSASTSGRRRTHTTRGSSRRRERNVRLPVITENVEVKPNVRLSLKLYESLRPDNLNITEDSSDEGNGENNHLTVDDILAEVMTYCRENDVPIKENRFKELDVADESDELYACLSDFKSNHTYLPDDQPSAKSEIGLTFSENSTKVALHNTTSENCNVQRYQQLPQPSAQHSLISDPTHVSSITATGCTYISSPLTLMENKPGNETVLEGCTDTYLGKAQSLEEKSSDDGGHETVLGGCAQVEEQDDDGSVLLEDACNSSCSSGSDSGRGESETSCPTPEEHLSCNSGGSDDGMWTIEDYSCLNHMISGSNCHPHAGSCQSDPQPESYETEQSPFEKIQSTSREAAGNEAQNTTRNFNSFSHNVDMTDNSSSSHACDQVVTRGWDKEKRSSYDAEMLLEESLYENHLKDFRKTSPLKFKELEDCALASTPKQSETLATLFEDYDNVDNCLSTGAQMVELEPELEIIDLNDKPTSAQQMISKVEHKKSKNFFGRRCSSFSTFRSFISSTTSHLKRNGHHRSSFSSSKSLPNYFSETKAVPDLTQYAEPQLKSIFKNNTNRNESNLKRNSSKRISFSDTVDVYPPGAALEGNAASKVCYRYPAELEIPEFSPKPSTQISSEVGKVQDLLEVQQKVDSGVPIENENAEHRKEICHLNEFEENSRFESVTSSSLNSLDLNDILLSLNNFRDEVENVNLNVPNSITKDVTFKEISDVDSKIVQCQELDSVYQTYNFELPFMKANYSSNPKMKEFSYSCPKHHSDHTSVKQSEDLNLSPSTMIKSEKPSGGSGQALLEALEMELEDVLKSLEDEETDLE